MHIDWNGTEKQLKEYDESYEKTAEKTEGIKFVGRLVPWNKKYHFTYVLKCDDITRFHKFGQNWFAEYARDYGTVSHGEYEFYSVP